MSWKNHAVETDSGSTYRIKGRKVRDISGVPVATFTVTSEEDGLQLGVIDSRFAVGPRGAEVVRFYGYTFNGDESVSRSLSEAVAKIVDEFERGSTEYYFGLLDLIA